jgi:hypothetical protein
VAIEIRGGENSRYQVILYENATGILRDAELPETRYIEGKGRARARFFDNDQEALAFKDEVLSKYNDLEVVVRPAILTSGGRSFFSETNGVIRAVAGGK